MSSNLLSFDFWFNFRPEPLTTTFKIVLLVWLTLLLVLFLVIKIRQKQGKINKFWLRLATFSLTSFILGLVLLALSQEMIPFFSAKFWFLLWIAIMVAWLVVIVLKLKSSKNKKESAAKKLEYQKYLPK